MKPKKDSICHDRCNHPIWFHRCCYCKVSSKGIINGKCRSCGNEIAKKRYQKDKPRMKELRLALYEKNPEEYKKRTRDERAKLRRQAIEFYGGKKPECECCKEKEYNFLCLDHYKNDGAKDRKENGQGATFYRSLKKRNYPEGLRVLCFNCNMARQFLGICPHRKVPTIESGSKNAKVLREFFLYAESHPGYRFWQALAGFTGGKQVLLWKPPEPGIMLSIPRVGLEDPFYYEGKDK